PSRSATASSPCRSGRNRCGESTTHHARPAASAAREQEMPVQPHKLTPEVKSVKGSGAKSTHVVTVQIGDAERGRRESETGDPARPGPDPPGPPREVARPAPGRAVVVLDPCSSVSIRGSRPRPPDPSREAARAVPGRAGRRALAGLIGLTGGPSWRKDRS